MSKPVRILLLVLSILLVLSFIAGFVYARYWLDPMLKEELVKATARSSKDLYALRLDRIHVNIFTGRLEADGVALSTDSVRWEAMYQEKPDSAPLKINLLIKRLRVKDIGWIKYWRTKKLDLDGIEIVEPELDLVSVKDTAQPKLPEVDTLVPGMLDRLPERIAPFTDQLYIGYVAITNGKCSFRNLRQNQSSYQQADSINGVLSRVNIVANDTAKHSNALFCRHILLTMLNYEFYPAGSVYAYRIKSATIDGQDDLIKLQQVSILPTIADAEFMKRLTLRVPRVKINMKEIIIRKLNLFRALHKAELTMESVVIESAQVKLYQDKNLPLSRHKRMPHELFRNIKVYLNIDTILLRNSNILYTELLENDKGQLEFEHANGVILNVTNDTLKMSNATPARIDARAELMGAGLLDLSLQFPLLSQTFNCDYSAHLGRIDMTYLNRLVEDKNNFRIESGIAQKMELKVQVRNGLAQGTIEATYDDLKISVLREKDGSKKKLISAVANLVLRGKNELGSASQPFKIGTIYYLREPTDGIVRYIWRSAQMGLMETLVPKSISGGKMPD